MICQPCGGYANATVVGQNGGRIPVCDDCIGTEPYAVYKTPTEIFPVRRPRDSAKHQEVPKPGRLRQPEGATAVASEAPEASARIHAPAPHAPLVLELPEPPSANRWWRIARGIMHLSHEAKAYKALVAAKLGARTAFQEGPVSVVVVWRRERKAGDLDKRLGVLLDGLQGGAYANDSQVVQIWARRCDEHPTLQPGTVRVEVSAAP